MRRNSPPENDAEVDVDVKPAATPAQVAAVLKKAREQWSAETKIQKLEDQLKVAKAELKLIQTKELPELMTAASMDFCPLDKGYVVEVKNIVTASIPAADSDKAENAAERNKLGVTYMKKVAPDLLKNQIIIDFGIKEESFYKKFMRDLAQRKREVVYAVRTTVDSRTLAKWIRGQDELGKSVDEVALSVHRFKQTVINEPPKSKKAKVKV